MNLKGLVSGVMAVAAVCACANDPWPSYELVANGDFESGTVFGNNGGNYLDSGVTSAHLPGWVPTSCAKVKASGTYVNSGLNIGTYAMVLKTNNSTSTCYQDVTVPEPGVYRIAFQWVARPGGTYNKQTITVSFSQVVDGEVPDTNVLTTFAATTTDSLTAYHRTIDVKTAGTYRLLFSGTSSVDSSTAFDNVSVRKIDTLLENGFFDSGSVTANSGTWSYSNGSGFNNPGWELNDKCGIAKAGAPWVAGGRPVGEFAMFVQSNNGADGIAYQDVTIDKPGLYTLAFDYAARPGYPDQTAKAYFGQITGDKTDLNEDDLLETFSPASDVYTSYSRPVAVLSVGTYRLKFVGSSSSDKATTYDNVRLFASEELITNGEFEEGSFSVKEPWGAYASFENYSNPGWQVNNPGRVGLGCPFGTWMATGLEVGKYAMFIQTRDSEGDTIAYQDVAVSAPGTYRVSLNYVARGGQYTGQTITISFGPLEDGEITNDLIADQFVTTTGSELTPYEKYITVETTGTYRLQFTALSSQKDCATAIDCVSIRRQTEYCFWTGGGDGETISDPANWGRAVISPVDDLCFTNDTALVLSMPADFTASSLNFFGTGAVTVNGVVPGGDATTAKTLTIGKIVSTSAAANTFNCPVAFTTDYNVNSAGPAEFPYGVTAMGWGTVDGAGGLRLSGPTFTFSADTVTISGNATLAAGGKLYANNLTGVSGQTLTIESGSRVELTGDLTVGEGANGRLYIAMADGAELFVGGTVHAWYDKFTTTRKYGTVWADAITLDVGKNMGFYAERINLGSGGISFIGETGSVNMDISGSGAYGTYLFGAYGDWTWADGGKGVTFYASDVKFDTLDCFDGETAHTITIEKSFNNTAAKLYKINPGTLVLAAGQYFTGGTFLEGGKIVVSAANGSGTGPLTLADGTTLEVAEGGVLGNATTTISEGAALTFKAGSGLSSAITVGGPVTIEGNMTFSGTPSITVPEGGSLVIAEGAKITVADDVQESTLITGLALTATQLEELFDTPYGAVKLNANGDVVYFNAFMWESALAGEDLYFKYGITATANVLIGAACEETDVVRYVESANATRAVSGETPNSVLTDGDVHLVGRYNVTDSHYEKMYAITSGTFAWTFPAADIDEIAVFSRWGDGGRDGVVVDAIYVKYDDSDWTQIMVSPISVGLNNNSSSQGSICAVLKRADGSPIAKNVTGLKVVFPAAQDNSGAGYAEVVAYPSVPKASCAYTWGNATGNKLFSDAGNWTDDATGAAVGEPGTAFAPTAFDSLTFPASASVIVDKSATVFSVALNAGVALNNPDDNTKNTLSFCKLSNDGAGMATVSCGAEFCVKYDVALQGPVDFAGGASAWSVGPGANAYEHTFKGDIEFLDGLGITTAEPTWTVPSGSRIAAPSLMRNTTANVNGAPAFRIEEGAYAHFGSVAAGRDNMYLSVLGEIEVDGLYTVRSCVRGEDHFEGDFGYVGDVNAAGGTIRAGGLKRLDFSTDASYPDDYSYIYPANLYIGELGISQDTAENGIVMKGSAKSVYATANFAICGPDASSGLLALESDTTFDTQGYTVTWTSGISGVRTLTKNGEGTLVMSPCTSTFGGTIVVNGGVLAIQNDTLTAVPVTLAEGTAIAVGANRTVPAAGTLTASGPAKVLVSGDMSEAKIGDSIPLFASCTEESFAKLQLDASGLQSLSLRLGAILKHNADGSVSLCIVERGLLIYIK